jgi:hypothetical protein
MSNSQEALQGIIALIQETQESLLEVEGLLSAKIEQDQAEEFDFLELMESASMLTQTLKEHFSMNTEETAILLAQALNGCIEEFARSIYPPYGSETYN